MPQDYDNYTDKMVHYFEESTKLNHFLKSFLTEITDITLLGQELIDERRLNTAKGVQLDQIGNLVGELRLSRNDEDYLLGIKLRIAINTSDGTVEDIINILKLLYPTASTYQVERAGQAKLRIKLGVDRPDTNLIPIIQQVIPAGVELLGINYNVKPLIFTERNGVITETGILPERGDTSPDVRIAIERE